MSEQKSTLQELEKKFEEKRNNPDKRDPAEKAPTGEVLHNPNPNPSKFEENTGGVGPNSSFPFGNESDKPAP